MSTIKTVLVLGHTGGIGSAVVEELSEQYDVVTPDVNWRYPMIPFFENFPKPDVIVNCVGLIHPAKITDEDTISHVIDEMRVNFDLPLELMYWYPDAIHINIGSSAASKPRGGWAGYCASKAALHSLVKSAADEGIQSYCISPGRTATKMRTKVAGEENPTTLLAPREVSWAVWFMLEYTPPNGTIWEIRRGENGNLWMDMGYAN